MRFECSHVPFSERLLPAPAGGGFAMEDWWVWCGSVVRGDAGRYHLYAARWPQVLTFLPAYQSYSEIVRAVSDTPSGPYAFAEVVLGDRGPDYWDGRMTHNPVVVRWRDRYFAPDTRSQSTPRLSLCAGDTLPPLLA